MQAESTQEKRTILRVLLPSEVFKWRIWEILPSLNLVSSMWVKKNNRGNSVQLQRACRLGGWNTVYCMEPFFFLICLDGSWQLSLYFGSVHGQWNVWETNTPKILICIWKIMVWKGAKGLGQDKFILSFTHSIDKFAVFALLLLTSWLPRGWH